ncbi:Arabinose import ATP-binding protein AraG [compost metagenome]
MRLSLRGLQAPGVKTPIDLSVRAGEIVGLFGLVGAGRSELMKGIFGATRVSAGQLMLDGQALAIRSPIDAIRAGIMLCPEDRKADGIIPVHSVRDNINISARRNSVRAGCLIDNGWEASNAEHHIRALNIKTPSAEQLIMNLSGGNQQKAILGRWLSEDMKVILLDEPTRGIDVGAKHEIYNVIYQLAQRGIAVLFASSDLPEVLGLADRILVMREGALSGELLHDDASEEKALSLAMLRTPEIAPDTAAAVA